ncbi:MAG: L-threonylcarbamoyladenylate synthase [Anaerolineae bacterium]
MTKRLTALTGDTVHEEAILEAAAALRQGKLVAFPTETVYGLGANALHPEAVRRVFEAKSRPPTDPLIVHLHSGAQLELVARAVPALAQALIEAFWPGPLTLVMHKTHHVADAVTAGLPTVAVRMPDHPVALALLAVAGVPVVAPRANVFSHTSPTTADHVMDDLDGRIDYVLDGGPTAIGVESTVLDVTIEPPRILRPGGTPLEDLQRFARMIEVRQPVTPESHEPQPSPGMMQRHYSPRASVLLFDGEPDKVRSGMRREADRRQGLGDRVGVLTTTEDRYAFADLGEMAVGLGSLSDLDAVARNLYAAMRALDARGVDVILARMVPEHGTGLAIRDRLLRAAEGRIILVD